VSAFSFWEIAMLAQRQRIKLYQPAMVWRQRVLESGVNEVPVSGDIAIMAAQLEGFHLDPADRVIAATAVLRGATLLTADERILTWNGDLRRHDARR
jgi:PIN domain nuclease of toxin-antitoxin system